MDWRELNRELINCEKCKSISKTRSRTVQGIGNIKAKILIVGLAPGREGADLTGIPFTRDPSGKLINKMLSVAGLARNRDVFITNLVKCNPKDMLGRNRSPTKKEIENCLPYLNREIEYLKPLLIVTLGSTTTELILNRKIKKMNEYHGKTILKDGKIYFPFIHPGYIVRGAYNKHKYLEEFKLLGNIFVT